MDNIYKISVSLIIGLTMIMFMSCANDDKWSPGPQMASDNPGAYFDKSNPTSFQIEVDGDNELKQDYVIITLGRDKAKSASAIQVPITILSADANLSIPQTVEFAAGSTTAELKITMTEYEGGSSSFSIEIDEDKYFNQYSDGYFQYSGQIKALVILTATFTPTDYSGSNKPEFTPFEQTIYDNQDGTYTIENFLFNNAGYNFTFSVDSENNIIPASTDGYNDTSENRWYFYKANSSSSSNRIPCYIPGNNASDYITYVYFYTKDNTSSYQAFSFDRTAKTGRMMGYARYSVSSSGRIAFNITW